MPSPNVCYTFRNLNGFQDETTSESLIDRSDLQFHIMTDPSRNDDISFDIITTYDSSTAITNPKGQISILMISLGQVVSPIG